MTTQQARPADERDFLLWQRNFAKTYTKCLPIILGSLTAIAPLSIDMYLPSLPQLAGEFATTASLIQLSLTACLLGIAAGQMFAGPLSDIYGRRKPLLIGMAVFTLSSLACAFAPSIEALLLLRLIQGLSGSAGIVIARAIARDLYSGYELTRFFTLLMLVNGAAPILAPVLGGQILSFASWRGVFITLSLLGALMFLSVMFWCKESLPPIRRLHGGVKSSLAAFHSLLKQPYFMGHALMQGFAFSALFAYIAGSPFVLQNIYEISPGLFGIIFGVNGIGLIAAGQVTGRLSGRIPDEKLLKFGIWQAILASLAMLAGIIGKAPLAWVLIPLFFTVSSLSVVASSSFSLAMQPQGKMAGSAAALLGFFSNISGGCMAPLVGIAGSHTALPMALIIAASEICAGVCFWSMVQGKEKK